MGLFSVCCKRIQSARLPYLFLLHWIDTKFLIGPDPLGPDTWIKAFLNMDSNSRRCSTPKSSILGTAVSMTPLSPIEILSLPHNFFMNVIWTPQDLYRRNKIFKNTIKTSTNSAVLQLFSALNFMSKTYL
jgi:hypothetical protein